MTPPSPERRFAALAVAEPDVLADLAERVLAAEPTTAVHSGPRAATMLVELTESVRSQPFHLGEVVVSEAQATVAGHLGHGQVIGHDPQRALAAAICDAAAEAGVLSDEIEHLVARTEQRIRQQRADRAHRVAATRVSMEVIG